MIAWYLYGKDTKANRENTVAFAEMVAEQMLVSLLHRYHVSEVSNVIYYKNVWNRLGEEFNIDEIDALKDELKVTTHARMIVHRWKDQNLVEKTGKQTYKKKQI